MKTRGGGMLGGEWDSRPTMTIRSRQFHIFFLAENFFFFFRWTDLEVERDVFLKWDVWESVSWLLFLSFFSGNQIFDLESGDIDSFFKKHSISAIFSRLGFRACCGLVAFFVSFCLAFWLSFFPEYVRREGRGGMRGVCEEKKSLWTCLLKVFLIHVSRKIHLASSLAPSSLFPLLLPPPLSSTQHELCHFGRYAGFAACRRERSV